MTPARLGHCLATLEATISGKSFERRSLASAIERSKGLPRLQRLQETVARLDGEIAALEAEVAKVTDGMTSEEVSRIVEDHHFREMERRRADNNRLMKKLFEISDKEVAA